LAKANVHMVLLFLVHMTKKNPRNADSEVALNYKTIRIKLGVMAFREIGDDPREIIQKYLPS